VPSTLEIHMSTSNRSALRTLLRRRIRDESASPVFTDDELDVYYANAIREYSKDIPREISETLNLVAGQSEYNHPEGLREIVSIKVGVTEFTVIDIFAGMMTISPTPTAASTAVFRYRGCHTIPASGPDHDNEASSYDAIDEPLILMHIIAQCWETLAGDGARYYEYQEGDVRENQGKTQSQFRAEADSLFSEFNVGVAKSKSALLARRPVTTTPVIAGVSSRKPAPRSKTIYRR
jgi:hypothetical protein